MARIPEQPPVKIFWEGGDPGRSVEWVGSAEEADLVVVPAASSPGASDSVPADPGDLTDREAEVLSYLADGWSNDEIADRLAIGVRTVRFHLDHLYRKLGVGRRTEAVREAVTRGYLRF